MARYQGLNTGVVLYNLARMRESKKWQNYLDKVDFMSFLCLCYSLLMFKLQRELFMTTCSSHNSHNKNTNHTTHATCQSVPMPPNIPVLISFSGERCQAYVQLWVPCHCWRPGLVHKCQLQCKINIWIQLSAKEWKWKKNIQIHSLATTNRNTSVNFDEQNIDILISI